MVWSGMIFNATTVTVTSNSTTFTTTETCFICIPPGGGGGGGGGGGSSTTTTNQGMSSSSTTTTSISAILTGATHYVARIYQGNSYTLSNSQAGTNIPLSTTASDLATLARGAMYPYFHELIYFGIPQVVSSSGSISLSSSTIQGWNTIVNAIFVANPDAKVCVMLSLGSTSGTNIQSSAAVTALQNINSILNPEPSCFDFDFPAQTPSNVQSEILSYLASTGQASSGWSGSTYSYGKATPGQALSSSGNFVGHYVTTIPSSTQENCVNFVNQPSSTQISDIQTNAQSQTSTVRMAFPIAQAWCSYAVSWWAFDYPSVISTIENS